MLLFEHYVAPSPIHGLGVFSACFIPKGTRTWEFHPAIDILIPRAELAGLPAHVLRLVAMRTEYLVDQDAYLWGMDGDQFVNHTDDPSIRKVGSEWITCRDIGIGEEVTYDYRDTLVPGYNPDDGLPHSGHCGS